jgi:hypothetical protein
LAEKNISRRVFFNRIVEFISIWGTWLLILKFSSKTMEWRRKVFIHIFADDKEALDYWLQFMAFDASRIYREMILAYGKDTKNLLDDRKNWANDYNNKLFENSLKKDMAFLLWYFILFAKEIEFDLPQNIHSEFEILKLLTEKIIDSRELGGKEKNRVDILINSYSWLFSMVGKTKTEFSMSAYLYLYKAIDSAIFVVLNLIKLYDFYRAREILQHIELITYFIPEEIKIGDVKIDRNFLLQEIFKYYWLLLQQEIELSANKMKILEIKKEILGKSLDDSDASLDDTKVNESTDDNDKKAKEAVEVNDTSQHYSADPFITYINQWEVLFCSGNKEEALVYFNRALEKLKTNEELYELVFLLLTNRGKKTFEKIKEITSKKWAPFSMKDISALLNNIWKVLVENTNEGENYLRASLFIKNELDLNSFAETKFYLAKLLYAKTQNHDIDEILTLLYEVSDEIASSWQDLPVWTQAIQLIHHIFKEKDIDKNFYKLKNGSIINLKFLASQIASTANLFIKISEAKKKTFLEVQRRLMHDIKKNLRDIKTMSYIGIGILLLIIAWFVQVKRRRLTNQNFREKLSAIEKEYWDLLDRFNEILPIALWVNSKLKQQRLENYNRFSEFKEHYNIWELKCLTNIFVTKIQNLYIFLNFNHNELYDFEGLTQFLDGLSKWINEEEKDMELFKNWLIEQINIKEYSFNSILIVPENTDWNIDVEKKIEHIYNDNKLKPKNQTYILEGYENVEKYLWNDFENVLLLLQWLPDPSDSKMVLDMLLYDLQMNLDPLKNPLREEIISHLSRIPYSYTEITTTMNKIEKHIQVFSIGNIKREELIELGVYNEPLSAKQIGDLEKRTNDVLSELSMQKNRRNLWFVRFKKFLKTELLSFLDYSSPSIGMCLPSSFYGPFSLSLKFIFMYYDIKEATDIKKDNNNNIVDLVVRNKNLDSLIKKFSSNLKKKKLNQKEIMEVIVSISREIEDNKEILSHINGTPTPSIVQETTSTIIDTHRKIVSKQINNLTPTKKRILDVKLLTHSTTSFLQIGPKITINTYKRHLSNIVKNSKKLNSIAQTIQTNIELIITNGEVRIDRLFEDQTLIHILIEIYNYDTSSDDRQHIFIQKLKKKPEIYWNLDLLKKYHTWKFDYLCNNKTEFNLYERKQKILNTIRQDSEHQALLKSYQQRKNFFKLHEDSWKFNKVFWEKFFITNIFLSGEYFDIPAKAKKIKLICKYDLANTLGGESNLLWDIVIKENMIAFFEEFEKKEPELYQEFIKLTEDNKWRLYWIEKKSSPKTQYRPTILEIKRSKMPSSDIDIDAHIKKLLIQGRSLIRKKRIAENQIKINNSLFNMVEANIYNTEANKVVDKVLEVKRLKQNTIELFNLIRWKVLSIKEIDPIYFYEKNPNEFNSIIKKIEYALITWNLFIHIHIDESQSINFKLDWGEIKTV